MVAGLGSGTLVAERLRVERLLAEGGMAAVYEVRHVMTGASYALKVMRRDKAGDATLRARFEQECALTATIVSDHVVAAFDAGRDDASGLPFLVMERLVGEDLGATLRRRGPLPPEEVAVLLRQLARALERIHAAGVVHRDLKPSNLFLTTADDGGPRLKVIDFGAAKRVADTTGTVEPTAPIGTRGYMAPEQLEGDGDIGAEADVYAFAQVAFTLLTGEPYWSADLADLDLVGARRRLRDGLPEPASTRAARRGIALPRGFDAWFARATAPAPEDRPARPLALAAELDGWLASPASTARWRRRVPLAAAALAGAVAALAVPRGVDDRPTAALPALPAAPAASSSAAAAPPPQQVEAPPEGPPAISAPRAGPGAPSTPANPFGRGVQ